MDTSKLQQAGLLKVLFQGVTVRAASSELQTRSSRNQAMTWPGQGREAVKIISSMISNLITEDLFQSYLSPWPTAQLMLLLILLITSTFTFTGLRDTGPRMEAHTGILHGPFGNEKQARFSN